MAKAPQDEDRAARARLDALKGALDRRAAARRGSAGPADGTGAGGLGGAAVTAGLQAGGAFVGAIVFGAAIGWGLDRWLGTKPWLTIVCFLLGAAAGVQNVIRIASPKGRVEERNSPLSGGRAPDKDEPRPASAAAPKAPSKPGREEDEG